LHLPLPYGKGKNDDHTHDFVKANTAGEDAYFVTHQVVGVADGVGGWADVGVDSGEISRSLMAQAKSIAESGFVDPLQILSSAYENVVKSKKVKAGSTTAIIASLLPSEGESDSTEKADLKVANLGDSGLIVLRDGALIYRTHEQQLQFNTPYQLSILPPNYNPNMYITCKPEQADLYTFQVQKGDLVVVGTDGLFDNLFQEDIIAVVAEWSKQHGKNGLMEEEKRNDLAKMLVEAARNAARDNRRVSPFAQSARNMGFSYIGGKWDDVVVVVSFVLPVVQSKL